MRRWCCYDATDLARAHPVEAPSTATSTRATSLLLSGSGLRADHRDRAERAAVPGLHGDADDVPVVDGDGRLVSVCTRHDLLSARMALLDHETPRPGWLARRRFRPADDLAHGRAS